MAGALRLHHMGFVVADIATAMPAFTRSMAASGMGRSSKIRCRRPKSHS